MRWALWANGEAENLSIFDPASPSTEAIRSVSIVVLVTSLVIFLIVEAVLFYSVFRFRKRKGEADDVEPAQVYGSMPIEVAWTAAPAIIVFILMLVMARTLWEVEVDPPEPAEGDNALFVTVVGRQWWWEYRYDYYNGKKLDFITANELRVPVSEEGKPRKVFLTLKSADVVHSYWVPRLAGKTDVIPGRVNHMWFQSSKPGRYLGQCAEYCGIQHAKMLLRVYVDPVSEFENWLDLQAGEAEEQSDAEKGRQIFLSQSCINCHRVRGTKAKGTYAPDLTHLMSRDTLASGIVANDRENLTQWVRDPQQVKPGCLMPAFGLKEEDLELVVEYLLTLR